MLNGWSDALIGAELRRRMPLLEFAVEIIVAAAGHKMQQVCKADTWIRNETQMELKQKKHNDQHQRLCMVSATMTHLHMYYKITSARVVPDILSYPPPPLYLSLALFVIERRVHNSNKNKYEINNSQSTIMDNVEHIHTQNNVFIIPRVMRVDMLYSVSFRIIAYTHCMRRSELHIERTP